MAIDQYGRFRPGMQPVGVDQRLASGLDEADMFESDAAEMRGQPQRRPPEVSAMRRLRTDAGKPHEFHQLRHEPWMMRARPRGRRFELHEHAWLLVSAAARNTDVLLESAVLAI